MGWAGACGGGAGGRGPGGCGAREPRAWALGVAPATPSLRGPRGRGGEEGPGAGEGRRGEGGGRRENRGVSVRERLHPALPTSRPAPPKGLTGTEPAPGPVPVRRGDPRAGPGLCAPGARLPFGHRVPRGSRLSLGSSSRTPRSPPHPLRAPGSPKSNARRPLPVTLATAGWGRDLGGRA